MTRLAMAEAMRETIRAAAREQAAGLKADLRFKRAAGYDVSWLYSTIASEERQKAEEAVWKAQEAAGKAGA